MNQQLQDAVRMLEERATRMETFTSTVRSNCTLVAPSSDDWLEIQALRTAAKAIKASSEDAKMLDFLLSGDGRHWFYTCIEDGDRITRSEIAEAMAK